MDRIADFKEWVANTTENIFSQIVFQTQNAFLYASASAERGLERVGVTNLSGEVAVFTAIAALLCASGMIVLLAMTRSQKSKQEDLKDLTARPKRFGLLAAAVLLLFFGGWSIYAPLASASMAMGVVSPDGSRKTVAHLEGGIIRSINVKEGDRVQQGDVLLVLDDIQARSQFETLQERLTHLAATRARLQAQMAEQDEITFPQALLERSDEKSTVEAMAAQKKLFDSQTATIEGQKKILNQRILQLEEQNAGLTEVGLWQDQQIELIQQEIGNVQQLFDQGLAQMSRLLALKRESSELQGEKAANRARIAENKQKIGETQIQLFTIREQTIETASTNLADIERVLAEIRSQLPSRSDILHRTIIRAPIAGTVMNVQPTTQSGVIRPGDPILEIVPREASLVIDAKVQPNDIERVHAGMEARVVLTAYHQRNLPLIHGTLRTVSADRMVEQRSGEPYFLAKVEVNPDDLAQLDNVRLVPGMQAEVMILNGEQSLLHYLLSPFLQSINKSFREG